MARRPVLHLAVLLAALSLLLPLAAEASCADCLGTDCCPPSCCPCCLHAPVLTGMSLAQAHLTEAGLAGNPIEARTLPSDPRAVFHVPKLV